jgi:hypothetical protein
LQDYCQPEILRQRPEFNDIDISMITEGNYLTWLTEQRRKYRAFITVTTIE